jgi:parallel beta-helix repeat protein
MQTTSQLRKWLAAGIILIFIGTTFIPSSGQTIEKSSLSTSRSHWLYVGGTGPGNFSAIQDAINASSDGDTVFVYAGTYYERLRVFKSIILRGQTVNTTIVDGQDAGTVVLINANVTISGFTIQHSGLIYGSEAGISTKSQPDMMYVMTVTGNLIRDNNIGVIIQDSSHHNIYGNTFMNNEKGIALYRSQDCIITHNNFINNTVHGFFRYFFFLQKRPRNNWVGNYWDDWHSMLPKPIKGTKEWLLFVLRPGAVYTIPFKWVNFDWHPATEPYGS